jgi:hypothetical protein
MILPCLLSVIEHFLACRFQCSPSFSSAQNLSILENPYSILNIVEAKNVLRPPLPGRTNPIGPPQAV